MDVKKSYIGMLTATAERIHGNEKPAPAVKIAAGPLVWGSLAAALGGSAWGLAKAAGSGAVKAGVPTAAFYYFLKYIGIPAGVGYILGDSLATSTSPNKDDLRTAENNALAKETVNKTKELEKMPSVQPVNKPPKDLSWIGM